MSAGIKIIESISYSMIVKYKKICANCEKWLIDELNAVVDNASKRLIGKPFSKNLKRADIPNDEYKTITVKLVTIETQKKKKKIILLGTLGAAIVAVGIILLIVFLI